MNIAKCLSVGFLEEHLLFIIPFRNLARDDRILWKSLGCKIDICHISCVIAFFSFITLVLQSEVHCYFLYILFLYENF